MRIGQMLPRGGGKDSTLTHGTPETSSLNQNDKAAPATNKSFRWSLNVEMFPDLHLELCLSVVSSTTGTRMMQRVTGITFPDSVLQFIRMTLTNVASLSTVVPVSDSLTFVKF